MENYNLMNESDCLRELTILTNKINGVDKYNKVNSLFKAGLDIEQIKFNKAIEQLENKELYEQLNDLSDLEWMDIDKYM